ncbi:MAG: class I SAM-dependent methyltransferase [Gemmatimonadaceae bacterium]
MTIDEAVRYIRSQPLYADLVRDAYLGRDVADSARRFADSAEFGAVRRLISNHIDGAVALDLGAGTGIGSFALARAGAKLLYALEPDPSDEVGQGAIRRLAVDLPIQILEAEGEAIPLPDGSVDIVYSRQVLHHIRDLPRAMAECARVLRHGGLFIACREHVVDDSDQLDTFLAAHPMHQLAGGENAYSLAAYLDAIRGSGMTMKQVIKPWDSVVNAFPAVRSDAEMQSLPERRLREQFGTLGAIAGRIAPLRKLAWARITRPLPGRMYSFVAVKA